VCLSALFLEPTMQAAAHGSPPAQLLLLTAMLGATTAAAQDSLRGRDLYLNAALVKQQPGMRSCVQCHGLPPDRKLWGASPAQLQAAFASVTLMGRFATELQAADVADLSAFLAQPTAVPLPLPRLSPLAPRFAALPSTSSAPLGFVLDNGGSGAFSLGAEPVRVIGADAASFRLEANGCVAGAQVAPGAGCGFTLRYAPGENAPAAAQAELRIEYGSIARATTVQLRGTADAVAAPTLSATGLSFAAQAVGSRSAPQQVELINTGQAVLALSAVNAGGADAGDFAVEGSCRATTQLAPGAQCALQISFAPTATGSRAAQVDVISESGSVAVSLSGVGEAPVAPPPAPPPPVADPPPRVTSSGGEGGGGAVSPLWAALLLALALGRRARRAI
jgi:cytochrome c553